MSRLPLALGAVAALAVGLLLLLVAPRDEPTRGTTDPGAAERLEQRVEQIAQRLDEEITRREALEEALSAMAAELASAGPETGAEPAPEAADGATEADSQPAPPPATAAGLDVEALVGAGFARRDAEAYAEFVDDIEMRRLDLRDRAAREGWLRRPRFAVESQALTDELEAIREEFGEEFDDWARYASGQTNRLRIGDVLADSPAAEAGFEAGDVVQRYAGAPVLALEELQDLTVGGVAGESTEVDVLRGGELRRLYVPRGPLGIRLIPIRQQPAPLR